MMNRQKRFCSQGLGWTIIKMNACFRSATLSESQSRSRDCGGIADKDRLAQRGGENRCIVYYVQCL